MQKLFILILSFAIQSFCWCQPDIEFIPAEVNQDSVPLRKINGNKRMVVVAKFKNTGNAPLEVSEISTNHTDYYNSEYFYLYRPAKPVPPGEQDSVVVFIEPDPGALSYYHVSNDWEFELVSNALYSRPFRCHWGTSKLSVNAVLEGYPDNNPELVEGKEYKLNLIFTDANHIPMTIDSVVLQLTDGVNRAKANGVFPVTIDRQGKFQLPVLINTSGLYSAIIHEYVLYFHYPNRESVEYHNVFRYRVIPDVVLKWPGVINFDTIVQGDIVSDSFDVENKGTLPVTLYANCSPIEDVLLKPGETKRFPVIYDSRFDRGAVEKKFYIRVKPFGTEHNLVLRLKGYVLPRKGEPVKHLRFLDSIKDLGEVKRPRKKRFEMRNDTLFTALKVDSFQFVNVSPYLITFSVDLNKTGESRPTHIYPHRRREDREVAPGDTGTVYFVLDLSEPGKISDLIIVNYGIFFHCDIFRAKRILEVRGRIKK